MVYKLKVYPKFAILNTISPLFLVNSYFNYSGPMTFRLPNVSSTEMKNNANINIFNKLQLSILIIINNNNNNVYNDRQKGF